MSVIAGEGELLGRVGHFSYNIELRLVGIAQKHKEDYWGVTKSIMGGIVGNQGGGRGGGTNRFHRVRQKVNIINLILA